VIHCVEQAMKGGKSIYVDAFNGVKELKRTCPEAFDVLKTFHVRYFDVGPDVREEYLAGYSHPVIKYVEHFSFCAQGVCS
jgi:hypothetical protein